MRNERSLALERRAVHANSRADGGGEDGLEGQAGGPSRRGRHQAQDFSGQERPGVLHPEGNRIVSFFRFFVVCYTYQVGAHADVYIMTVFSVGIRFGSFSTYLVPDIVLLHVAYYTFVNLFALLCCGVLVLSAWGQ